jgi:hypothetical protein
MSVQPSLVVGREVVIEVLLFAGPSTYRADRFRWLFGAHSRGTSTIGHKPHGYS